MVKHIILWKLKEDCNTAEIKRRIKNGLEGLQGVVPGLLEIEVKIEALSSSNVDIMLYSVLESVEALKEYAVHPERVKVAETLIKPFTETRNCIDFEE